MSNEELTKIQKKIEEIGYKYQILTQVLEEKAALIGKKRTMSVSRYLPYISTIVSIFFLLIVYKNS